MAGGNVYKGRFADDHYEGHGVYHFSAEGDKYEGRFRESRRNVSASHLVVE
jgi:hypothetical protein